MHTANTTTVRQVAELELLVGSAKGSAGIDQIQAVEVLQKLLANIPRTERPRLKEYGRRCEAAMADILLRGIARPVGGPDCHAWNLQGHDDCCQWHTECIRASRPWLMRTAPACARRAE